MTIANRQTQKPVNRRHQSYDTDRPHRRNAAFPGPAPHNPPNYSRGGGGVGRDGGRGRAGFHQNADRVQYGRGHGRRGALERLAPLATIAESTDITIPPDLNPAQLLGNLRQTLGTLSETIELVERWQAERAQNGWDDADDMHPSPCPPTMEFVPEQGIDALWRLAGLKIVPRFEGGYSLICENPRLYTEFMAKLSDVKRRASVAQQAGYNGLGIGGTTREHSNVNTVEFSYGPGHDRRGAQSVPPLNTVYANLNGGQYQQLPSIRNVYAFNQTGTPQPIQPAFQQPAPMNPYNTPAMKAQLYQHQSRSGTPYGGQNGYHGYGSSVSTISEEMDCN